MLRFCIAFAASLLLASGAVAQEWTQMADMPGPGRHHPVNFVLDGKGYVVTGSTSSGSSSDDFYRYDPVTNTWDTLPDFPGSDRGYAYGGTYNGKGYLGFGQFGGYLKDLWEYDPVTEAWTQLADCPGLARRHPAFVVTDDGKIFVGMGNAAGNLRDWWEYDIATDTWVGRAILLGVARHHPYYFNIGEVPYVGFGHGNTGIYKDFYRYNRGDDTWTRMNDFPETGRVAGQQFSHNGKGYILSGDNQGHGHFPTGEFWEYDSDLDSWTELTPHPGSSRWAPGSFVIDSIVYMMGGLSSVRLEATMWSYPLLEPADVELPTTGVGPSFTVFPNPVRGGIVQILDPSSALGSGPVRLLNARGRVVMELGGSVDGVRIPSNISSGKYYLSLPTRNGDRQNQAITILR